MARAHPNGADRLRKRKARDGYDNTVSGLLRKRAEMMGAANRLREEMAVISNDIDALDRVLVSLGYDGDLKGIASRSNRVVFFARNELRRWLLNELRQATGPVTSRDLAEKLIGLEGKDVRDRRLRNDMVKRVGKALKLMRTHGSATNTGTHNNLSWLKSGSK